MLAPALQQLWERRRREEIRRESQESPVRVNRTNKYKQWNNHKSDHRPQFNGTEAGTINYRKQKLNNHWTNCTKNNQQIFSDKTKQAEMAGTSAAKEKEKKEAMYFTCSVGKCTKTLRSENAITKHIQIKHPEQDMRGEQSFIVRESIGSPLGHSTERMDKMDNTTETLMESAEEGDEEEEENLSTNLLQPPPQMEEDVINEDSQWSTESASFLGHCVRTNLGEYGGNPPENQKKRKVSTRKEEDKNNKNKNNKNKKSTRTSRRRDEADERSDGEETDDEAKAKKIRTEEKLEPEKEKNSSDSDMFASEESIVQYMQDSSDAQFEVAKLLKEEKQKIMEMESEIQELREEVENQQGE